MEAIASWLVDFVGSLGYTGVFIMTFLESTFVPLPAEVTMIPAGYLASQGEMNGIVVLLTAILGSLAGSLANYYIAYHYGRRFLYAYGKYMFFSHERMEKLDGFFARHGEISTLTGRLVPGLRHFISFPAGLGRMNVKKFSLYTAVGAGVWMAILIMIGYLIGGNKALVKHYTPYATATVLIVVAVMIILYIRRHKARKETGGEANANSI
ncbi:MAG TPA: DedA family protein [Rickettsiales bacterium]|nr:DedA family protein [Rickettsiales bacterium]